jgi:hypothetical protein
MENAMLLTILRTAIMMEAIAVGLLVKKTVKVSVYMLVAVRGMTVLRTLSAVTASTGLATLCLNALRLKKKCY